MKIAVITLFDNGNYGSELQAIAMNHLIKSVGHKAVFCAVKASNKIERVFEIAYDGIRDSFNQSVNHDYRNFKRQLKNNLQLQAGITQSLKTKIHEFMNEAISIQRVSKRAFRNSFFDYYIVGSDQIWSPVSCPIQYERFLSWVDDSKKMAYAPSMGVNSIPLFFLKKVSPLINQFSCLSFREKQTAELFSRELNRNVPFVLDPTLLAGKDFWREYISDTNHLMEGRRYVFCYFLGSVSKETISRIKYASKDKEIVWLPYDCSEITLKHLYLEANPQEFVSLVYHAEEVYTDSFHGACFSILFEKPLHLFDRSHKGAVVQTSRIQSLLEVLYLPYDEDGIKTIEARQKLEELRKTSYEFFVSGLAQVDGAKEIVDE